MPLQAKDANGKVIATLDYVVLRDDQGKVTGLLDFAAHVKAGRKLREIWNVEGAVKSEYVKPRKPKVTPNVP